jgi:hypothetical protein
VAGGGKRAEVIGAAVIFWGDVLALGVIALALGVVPCAETRAGFAPVPRTLMCRLTWGGPVGRGGSGGLRLPLEGARWTVGGALQMAALRRRFGYGRLTML